MIAALGPACTTEEAFEQMVLDYQMPLKRMCYMYLHDMSLAEDAVQETFLKVYRSLPQFSGGCSVKTWIMKIGVNTCRDMLRSAWFRHHDRRIVPEELPIPAEENLQPEESGDLGRAILELPVKYKDVILLYYYCSEQMENYYACQDQLSQLRTEIAAIVGFDNVDQLVYGDETFAKESELLTTYPDAVSLVNSYWKTWHRTNEIEKLVPEWYEQVK